MTTTRTKSNQVVAPSDPGEDFPLRILIVDDEEHLREMVFDYLAASYPAAMLKRAADGAGAISAAHHLRPHLVICDYNLPDMDGLEISRRIRASPLTSGTKFLIMTGNTEPGVHERLLANGIDACIAKPFLLKDLLAQASGLVRLES